MESLKRKPDLGSVKEITLPNGTVIGIRNVTVRTMMEVGNNKSMSVEERGMRVLAAKLLVDGKPIVYDDFLDCFTDVEANFIAEKIAEISEKNG
jgi:predicted acyltransferase (DUF342 family)